ncbi:MAG: 4'-phosphopantetheinyl transferase superfamily protein [Gammaproteobacteria bacterium]|nr:4'-phosphopantetheinyl transferase superfamily protein [Gammaproteobacteria bacterium]
MPPAPGGAARAPRGVPRCASRGTPVHRKRIRKTRAAHPPGARGLAFNASHCASLAVIAVARSGRIGIDVEALRTVVDAERIATRFFSPQESAARAALDPAEQGTGFLNCWTRKEAVVKALGGGLSIPLHTFAVTLQPRQPAAILTWAIPDAPAAAWQLHQLEPAAGYVGALVVERAATLRAWRQWPGPRA